MQTRFEIGVGVSCSDGDCGKLTSVVIDPMAKAVTHIVVEPTHRWGLARLVPLTLVGASTPTVQLRCTLAEFDALDGAEVTEFLTEEGAEWGFEGRVLSWPYYGLASHTGALDDFGANVAQPIVYEKLPVGEVGVRRGDKVHATDGDIGRVHGLVIDPSDNQLTHVLLQEGHLWGRKQVAIPVSAVESVNDGLRLSISKADIAALPDVAVDR